MTPTVRAPRLRKCQLCGSERPLSRTAAAFTNSVNVGRHAFGFSSSSLTQTGAWRESPDFALAHIHPCQCLPFLVPYRQRMTLLQSRQLGASPGSSGFHSTKGGGLEGRVTAG